MKSKVLLGMLIAFIVLAGLWIMNGTVFVIREVDVEIVDDSNNVTVMSTEEKEKLVDKIDLRGKNILFSVKQEDVANKISSYKPMLKVQTVAAEFPNRVVVKITKRVPIYVDKSKDLYFDEDMCILETRTAGCVDISGAEIEYSSTVPGHFAAGKTKTDQRKIEQLKVIGAYCDSITGWKINYSKIGDKLALNLTIAPNVSFAIATTNNQDFAKILAYTFAVYKKEGLIGKYQAWYNSKSNKVLVYVYSDDGELLYYE